MARCESAASRTGAGASHVELPITDTSGGDGLRVLLIGHGYVGSALRPAIEAAGHSIVVCDQNALAVAGLGDALCCRYQDLSIVDLASFDVILWFAGHSSVARATQDPDGALANNCFDLLTFARRKPTRVRLIYASTASVYSVPAGAGIVPPEVDETETRLNPTNAYDASKVAFDALAGRFATNVAGLRLGTVSGYSPNLRPELVFNAMNRSALEEGRVNLANAEAFRSILFLDDLQRYVLALLEIDELPEIINLSSMNVRLGELAEGIAAHHSVPVETKTEASSTYSFRMNCGLADRLCGPARRVSLSTRCEEFISALAATARI